MTCLVIQVLPLLLFLLFCTITCTTIVNAQTNQQTADYLAGNTAADKWAITPQPTHEYDDMYGFDFTYTVTNYIDVGQTGFYVYDGDCRSGGGSIQTANDGVSGFEYLDSILPERDVTPGSETDITKLEMNKQASFRVKIDPVVIPNNLDVFEGDMTLAKPVAKIVFCVVFYVQTKEGEDSLMDGGTSSLEVAAQETVVTLVIDFNVMGTDFIVKNIQLTPNDRLSDADSRLFTTVAYLCNPTDGSDITDSGPTAVYDRPFTQGQLITVCVRPDDDAIKEGVKMNSINTLTYEREDDATLTQSSIEQGIPSSNGLSDYEETNCYGNDYCSVGTMLFATFFDTPGSVSAKGDATIKFLTSRDRDRNRDLRRDRDLRSLQADADPDVRAFGVELDVIPIADNDSPFSTSAATTVLSTILSYVAVGSLIIITILSTTI